MSTDPKDLLNMQSIHSVSYEHPDLCDKARMLAEALHYSLDEHAENCLLVTKDKLALKWGHFSLLYADFDCATWKKSKSAGAKLSLVRACKPVQKLKIIDATAGWGKDAAVLASFGAEVLMVERHPVMGVLLQDALDRQNALDKTALQLSLYVGDAYTLLERLRLHEYPDVVYIDPMHPIRTKSALVKKNMQALQQMIGADEDASLLIEMARTRVKQKVVVKWPQKLKPLVKPDMSIGGTTVRFDIYTSRGHNLRF
jgi:16S rRNA (guanine1516-N2)-methyltransferase